MLPFFIWVAVVCFGLRTIGAFIGIFVCDGVRYLFVSLLDMIFFLFVLYLFETYHII